jgi:hypothetical protein
VSRTLQILLVTGCLMALAADVAAEQSPVNTPVTSSTRETETLQEVTVTAQHFKLDWAPRNELVRKAATFVFGIAAVDFYEQYPPIWNVPVCPLVTGLPREQGVFVFWRLSEIARAAGARVGGEECHPNLFIFVTDHPKELLRTMKSRRFLVIFGTATPSHVDQFINEPGAVKVWHNTLQGSIGTGPVNVVVDRTRLHGVSERQLADYLGMVILAEFKSRAHLGDAQTILKLFDGPPQAAPEGLSAWDQEFLKILYHPQWSLANPRANIARRMVGELLP